MKLIILKKREKIHEFSGIDNTPGGMLLQLEKALIKKETLAVESTHQGLHVFPYKVYSKYTFIMKEEIEYETSNMDKGEKSA
jgi:hypothetical protein